jgi:hypothetical protein
VFARMRVPLSASSGWLTCVTHPPNIHAAPASVGVQGRAKCSKTEISTGPRSPVAIRWENLAPLKGDGVEAVQVVGDGCSQQNDAFQTESLERSMESSVFLCVCYVKV